MTMPFTMAAVPFPSTDALTWGIWCVICNDSQPTDNARGCAIHLANVAVCAHKRTPPPPRGQLLRMMCQYRC